MPPRNHRNPHGSSAAEGGSTEDATQNNDRGGSNEAPETSPTAMAD